ncbi:MAG TPA: hypothetical protein ENK53_06910 [Thiotrichales bacterium]|nr:hypothetical protein [Thiotrichales bacterium]
MDPAPALARLCADDYAGAPAIRSVELDGMAASLHLARDLPPPGRARGPSLVLVCRGSDDPEDWARNFRFLPAIGMGASWRLWHRGFLQEARVVYGFVMGLPADARPDWITGHSRGAAVAQILGPSVRRRTVTFAPPRPLWLGPQPSDAGLVENHALRGDPVPYAGRLFGFRHVGRVRWLGGVGHGIRRYIAALENGR